MASASEDGPAKPRSLAEIMGLAAAEGEVEVADVTEVDGVLTEDQGGLGAPGQSSAAPGSKVGGTVPPLHDESVSGCKGPMALSEMLPGAVSVEPMLAAIPTPTRLANVDIAFAMPDPNAAGAAALDDVADAEFAKEALNEGVDDAGHPALSSEVHEPATEGTVVESTSLDDPPVEIAGKGVISFDEQPVGGDGASVNFFDEQPVGGGTGAAASAFDEQPVGSGTGATVSAFDEQPVGGGTGAAVSAFDEQPVGSGTGATASAFDDQPVGSGTGATASAFDEQPVGGGTGATALAFDEQPVGGGAASAFDEQPVGGGTGGAVSAFDEQPVGGDTGAAVSAFDEQPVGGGTGAAVSAFDEQPVGSGTGATASAFDEQPVGSGTGAAVSAFDEQPVGGGTSATASAFDEQPVGGGTGVAASAFDEQPVGGGTGAAVSAFDEQPVGSVAANSASVEHSEGGAAAAPLVERPLDTKAAALVPDERPLGRAAASAAGPNINGVDSMMAAPATPPSSGSATSGAPLSDRLVDKNWKVRKEALETATSRLSRDSSLFAELAPVMPAIVNENQATCLAAAVDCAAVFAAGPDGALAASVCDAVVPLLIDKGFCGRPAVAARAEAAVLSFMEVDTPGPTVHILLAKCGHKKPKVPPACLATLAKAVVDFGLVDFPVAEVLAALPPLFASSKAPVRDGATRVAGEIGKHTGAAVLAGLLEGLRDVQRQDVEKIVAEGPENPRVGLRKHQASAANTASDTKVPTAPPVAPKVDPRDFAPEVDLLASLRSTDFRARLNEAKWSEKVAALNLAITAIGAVPKLRPQDHSDLLDRIFGLVNHSHFQVCAHAVKLLTLMAEGLGADFRSQGARTVRLFLPHLNNKKLVRPVAEALRKLYGATEALECFGAVLDDIQGAMAGKKRLSAVHGREALLMVLADCLGDHNPLHPKGETGETMDELAQLAATQIGDRDPSIREAATQLLTALSQPPSHLSRGPKTPRILARLEEDQPRAFQRITTAAAAAAAAPAAIAAAPTASGSVAPSAPASSAPRRSALRPSAAPRGPPARSSPAETHEAPTEEPDEPSAGAKKNGPPKRRGPPARLLACQSKPTASGSRSSAVAGAGGSTNGAAAAAGPLPEENEDVALGIDDAEAILSDALGASIWAGVSSGLGSSKWQERQGALDSLGSALGHVPSVMPLLAPLRVVVAARTRGLKESNFNVMKAVLALFEGALRLFAADAAASGGMGKARSAVAPVANVAIAKVADRKLAEAAKAMLAAAAEGLGPSYVVRKAITAMSDARAPLLRAGSLDLQRSIAEDFGAGSLGATTLGALGQAAVTEVGHANATVRTAALNLLEALYLQVGPPLRPLVFGGSVADNIKATVESRFANLTPMTGYQPAKAVKVVEEGAGATASGGSLEVPRMDLIARLGKSVLADLSVTAGKNAWKRRLAALDTILDTVADSGYHIQGGRPVAELLRSLRARLGDTQANLKPKAARAISGILRGVGMEQAVRMVKLVMEPLVSAAGDNKKMMQKAALDALEEIITGGTPDEAQVPMVRTLLPAVASGLIKVPTARRDLLAFCKSFSVFGCLAAVDEADQILGVQALVACLLDRGADVRHLGQDALTAAAVGFLRKGRGEEVERLVSRQIRDKSPALRETVKAMVRRALAAAESDACKSDAIEEPQEEAKSSRESETRAPEPEPAAAAAPSRPARGPAAGKMRKPARARAISPPVALDPEEEDEEEQAEKGAVVTLSRTTGKARRLQLNARTEWRRPPEDPGAPENDELRQEWGKFLGGDLATALFPKRIGSMECGEPALALLAPLVASSLSVVVEHLDFILKWLMLRLCEREHSRALSQLLNFLGDLFHGLAADEYTFHDVEARILAPWLLEKAGFAKDRFRRQAKDLMQVLGGGLIPLASWGSFVADSLASRNVRSRVLALEELRRLTDDNDGLVLKKVGAKAVGKLLDARETDVRQAALAVATAVFTKVGDSAKVTRFLGGDNLSETAKGLLAEKMRRIEAQAGGGVAETAPAPVRAPARSLATAPAEVPVPAPRRAARTREPEMAWDMRPTEEDGHEVFEFQVDTAAVLSGTSTPVASPARSPARLSRGSPTGPRSPPLRMSMSPVGPVGSPGVAAAAFEESFVSLDALLRRAERTGPVDEDAETYIDAKKWIKRYHQLAHGEIDGFPEAVAAMRPRLPDFAEGIVARLTDIIRAAMRLLPESPLEQDDAAGGAIDVPLLSVTLAAVAALTDGPRFTARLGRESLGAAGESLLDAALDARFATPPDALAEVNYKSLQRALGRVALTLWENADRTAACCASVDLFGLAKEDGFQTRSVALLQRALREELRLRPPEGSLASVALTALLGALDGYFSTRSEAMEDVQDPARQLLGLVFQLRGPREVSRVLNLGIVGDDSAVMTLCATMTEDPPNRASVSRLVADGIEAPRTPIPGPPRAEEAQREKLASIVGRLGKGDADDEVNIRELYALQVEHPGLVIAGHLKNVSARFQAYILSKLEELHQQHAGQLPPAPTPASLSPRPASAAPKSPPESLEAPVAVPDLTNVAMRVSPRLGAAARADKMNELRKRLSNLAGGDGGSPTAAAPRSTASAVPAPKATATTLSSLTNIKSRLSRMQAEVSKSQRSAASPPRTVRAVAAEENDPEAPGALPEASGSAIRPPGKPVSDLKTRLARLKASRRAEA